jgi:Hydrophobic surface binding protein A
MLFKTFFLSAVAVLASVKADPISDFESAWSAVIKDVTSMNSQVAGFSSSQGLLAALSIQGSYSTLYSDVKTLVSKAQAITSVTDSQAEALIEFLNPTVGDIGTLLANLQSKASQFSAVGVQAIVSADLSSLQPQLLSVVSEIYSLVPCDEVASAMPLVTPILASLSAANNAYNVANSKAPAAPTAC